ncbi:hypothetical protein JW948_18350 [bacterium]|nr:hypothetical protein [bacterium]
MKSKVFNLLVLCLSIVFSGMASAYGSLNSADFSLNSADFSLNLVPNPGFESKSLDGWETVHACRIVPSSKASHSGDRAMAFYPSSEKAGVGLDLSSIALAGYRYFFSGWFRNADQGWGQVDVVLWVISAKDTVEYPVLGRVDCDKQNWARLSGAFRIPESPDPVKNMLVLRTSWGQNSFLVDDLIFRPALSISVDSPDSAAQTEIRFYLGPADEQRGGLTAAATLTDVRNEAVVETTAGLSGSLTLVLDPGYYHIRAGIEDLDGTLFEAEKVFAAGDPAALRENVDQQLKSLLGSESLSRYHGWLKYLGYLAASYREREGDDADRTLGALYHLDHWIQAVQDDPALLDTLSGVIEWAYSAGADSSGQPFKLAIPVNYDAGNQYPLNVVMHGHGGNHLEYSGGTVSNPEYFELHVLGRARGGGYSDLSEADVLDAVDYVKCHWSIDDRQVHITGASMGGGGTFKLASRYPHLWASARPVCGFGFDQPVENAVHVPFYSTHSQDDPTVPVLGSRAPLVKLREKGGQVVIDETTGLQHAAWNYSAGNRRAAQWFLRQARPEITDIRQIDFQAVDYKTRQAYWLMIREWGDRPGPAHIQANAESGNQIYLNLDNIRVLEIRVQDAPIDAARDLFVSVNQDTFLRMQGPLPSSVFISRTDMGWSVDDLFVSSPKLAHTPGSVFNMYGRDPLLIVYGTSGKKEAREAMRAAAAAASKSPHPVWAGDEGDGRDGMPHHQLLYGRLRIKADTAVTASDIAACHLVLIGRADENCIVDRMKTGLPVEFGREIRCSDGLKLDAGHACLGLYYYNPLNPEKMIYWVASAVPEVYGPYTPVLQVQSAPYGSDFTVLDLDPFRPVKIKNFNSQWQWIPEMEKVRVLTDRENTNGKVIGLIADQAIKATGSDMAFIFSVYNADQPAGISGITDWADLAATELNARLAVFSMKGSEILAYQKAFMENGGSTVFYGMPEPLEKETIYRIVTPAYFGLAQALINLKNEVPDSFRILDETVSDIIEHNLY